MYDIINMKDFRSKQDLLSQRLGRVEVAEEMGTIQVEHPEESAWADFAKSLILALQEDEKRNNSRGDIPAVVQCTPRICFSLWSEALQDVGSFSYLVGNVCCGCLYNAKEWDRNPPNCPPSPFGCGTRQGNLLSLASVLFLLFSKWHTPKTLVQAMQE